MVHCAGQSHQGRLVPIKDFPNYVQSSGRSWADRSAIGDLRCSNNEHFRLIFWRKYTCSYRFHVKLETHVWSAIKGPLSFPSPRVGRGAKGTHIYIYIYIN